MICRYALPDALPGWYCMSLIVLVVTQSILDLPNTYAIEFHFKGHKLSANTIEHVQSQNI